MCSSAPPLRSPWRPSSRKRRGRRKSELSHMVARANDADRRGVVLEQIARLELQGTGHIPSHGTRNDVLVECPPAAVRPEVDKDFVVRRDIIRLGAGRV